MRNSVEFSRRVVISVGILCLLSPVCLATDYYIWKGAAADSVATYSKYNISNDSGVDTGTAATSEIPSGSIVFIPNNTTYHVDDGTADFCGALGGLRLQGKDAVIELALENNHTFGCYIYGAGSTWAQVVKSGAGTLTLTADGTDLVASNRRMHYCAYWRVGGGEVVFWPSAAANTTYNIQAIWVDAGATVRLPPGKTTVFVGGFISGGGTIAHATGGEAGTLLAAGNYPTAVFTGTITGNVKVQLNGRVNFKTASNDFTGGIAAYAGGVLGFTDLGNNKASPSSVGNTEDIAIYNGLTLTNLIDETIGAKTSSRSFRYFGNSSEETYTQTFDGGEYGKFTFTGQLRVACNKVLSCILQGGHSNPCTFSPSVNNLNSSTGWYMLTKRGTGTWKMSGNYNTSFGGLMIENGILQMARIKAIGASDGGYTSCGWLTNTTRFCGYAYKGTVANAPSPVGYAIRLGKASDLAQCGILEYVGSAAVNCQNRAFALTGKGGFKNEMAQNFIIGPIASEPLPEGGDAPALNTLVLESSNSNVNETRNITENAGAIRVEKRGTGTWILNQDVNFTGGVDIQDGTLVISNRAQYAVLPSGLNYVKTRSGTTLKTIGDAVTINSLTIDATQGLGNIDNCAFATAGTIHLTNYTEKTSQNFAADLSTASGLANLADWVVLIDGLEVDRYKISAGATGLRVDYVPPGFIISVH